MITDERVDEIFSDVIREKMNDPNFWMWIKSWKDPESLCREAENWDLTTKREELKTFKDWGLIKLTEVL